jgi:hypothetical protein
MTPQTFSCDDTAPSDSGDTNPRIAVKTACGLRIPNRFLPQMIPVVLGLISHRNSLSLRCWLRLPEAVTKANREDRKEAGVAEIVIVARFEGGEVLLEARILADGIATH